MVFRVASGGGSSGLVIGAGATPITGGTASRVLFEGAGNVLAESADLTFAATTGILTIGGTTAGAGVVVTGGTITTAISLLSLTETRNNAAIVFPGLTYYVQSTAESGSTKLLTLNAGTTASNGNVGGLLFSAAGGSPQIDFLTNNGSRGHLLGAAGGGYDININAGSLNGSINMFPTGSGGVTVGSFYQEFTEMSVPSAGAANTARIFAQDNGAGKTQLMVIFNTGAAIQLAIQA